MGTIASDFTNYAGKVARAYELSEAPIAVIVGPTGGGKSQASARKILRVALKQHPSPRDGWRKAKICCVAPNYRILWDTAIKSFRKVWPDSANGRFRGSHGDPANYVIDIPQEGGGGLHIEVEFRALRDESAEEFVRGREVTAWWLPEMDTNKAEDLLALCSNRVGRYPEPDDRPELTPGMRPAYAGVFGDANAPVIGSWFYKRFYLKRQNADGFFRQPPALLSDEAPYQVNPLAENLHNLRKIRLDYYEDLASRMAAAGSGIEETSEDDDTGDYDINRLLLCKPGYSRFGKPVHKWFDHDRHVAKGAIPFDPHLPLRIGVDAGNTLKPAATFSQTTFSGQKRFLAEISPIDRQMDIAEFCEELRRMVDTRFAGVRSAEIIVDPSAKAKTTTNRQLSYAQLIQAHTRITVRLAPTNDPGLRRSAIDNLHKRTAGPGEPACIVDPEGCPRLIEGWAGGYRFKKIGDAYAPQPEKNDHSHEAEAAQYDEVAHRGIGGNDAVIPPRVGVADHPGVILD